MGKRKKYYKSRVPLGGSVSKNSSYKTPLARRLQRGEEPNSSGAQSTVLDQSSSAEGGASVGSAEFDSLNNAVIARFCQDRGVIAVDLSNAIVPLAITYSEHLSLPSVGYGALVPKAKDVLKVKLVDKAEKGEYCKAATDRYAIESVRLSQLSPRSSEEWLTFVEATRRHLESSGSNASIYDIGNLEIVWGQLLTADFSYVLSSAIGRFLLALRSRCRELRQYSLDSAFDWLLDQLMLSDCLSRLMKPLLLRAINLKQVKVAAVANEENENADQQILGPLTRLICSKDETVLNCKLLPMARELAPSQSDNDLLSLLHCRRLLQPASSCSTTRKPIDAVSNCESLSTEDYCEIVDAVELEDTYFEMPETRTEPFEEDERVKISEDNHDAKSLMTPPISQSLDQQQIAASTLSLPPLRFSLSKRLGPPLQHWPLPECYIRQSKSPPIPEDQGESSYGSERREPLSLQNNRKRTRSRLSPPPELSQLQPHRRTAHDRLGKRPKWWLRHSSPSEDQTRLPPKLPSHSPLPSVSQGQCSSDSAIVNRQRSKLKNSSVMADIIAWSSEGFGALIIDEKPNERYVVPISREEHISHLNVGYGFLEPKVKDVLKVTFKKTRSKKKDSDDETDSDEDGAIESVRLFQLSQRSPEEWLTFVDATRRHLESSGLKAKVNDIGNLEIVWGQLLTVDFIYVLSSAIGRFLLALRRRCRRFHRCSWDPAYDWILEKLMNPERLRQLMMPLVKMATTGKEQHLEPICSFQDKTEPENRDMSMAITDSEHTKKSESISRVEASASGESMDLKTKQNASAAHKLFGELARLTCAKDASVLDRVLLPMAQSLTTVIDPVEEDAEEDQQRRCHSILLEMLTVSVELQRRQQAALKTAGRGGILPSYAELTAESKLVSSAVDGTQMKTSNWLAGLQPALEIGAYRTVEEYIETMLGLLRADCFDKFHECMKQVKSGKLSKDSGLRLYLNVKVAAVKVATRGAALRIAVTFDLPAKDKGPSNWSKSSHLMQGNLLCLSLDEKFSQYFWATVVEKRQDELTKNERLVWIQPCKPERSGLSVGEALVTMLVNSTAASSGMLMLESPSMFRAFQPVLASLQSLSADCVPFADVLASAKVDSACIEPDFVTRYYNNEEPKTPLPSIKLPAGLNLDHCQAEAFANALHRRVYVCQGPPGTGKTLLGVLIAKQLLQLETLKGRPLLVLCYKNHALDEFLIKLLPEYEHRMVRVGGRSRDTRLENISLRAVRSRIKAFRPVNRLLDRLRENWEELKSCLEFLNKIFETPAGAIINACDYRQLYSIVHCNPPTGHVRDATLNDAHKFLKSVPPERLFAEIKKTTETYSAFNASVGYCLPSLPQGLEENRPQNLKVKLQTIKSKSTGQKLKENDEEDDGEEIREREEQLAMAARDDGPSTGNEMRCNVDLIRQSQLYLDSSIEECSQKDFMQRLLLKLPTQLSHTEQWLFYQLALNKICKETKERIEMLVERIMELEADIEQTNTEADAEVLSRMRVVGMTITGASINKELLDALKPAVVILEEAAEVSEPQLLACLGPHTEHLILIGDHKQLKPQTESHRLARDYHLDLSMMERLINNGINFDQLELQNRMRPEFSFLLRDIYPNLRDNHRVVNRKLRPPCFVQSMFFWTHTELETQEPEKHGATNIEEANRCVRLAMFLVDQGCSPDKITILCAYRRQTSLVRRLMKQALQASGIISQKPMHAETEHHDLQSEDTMQVNVHTIDLYQGDENDVVIVSLIRSNTSDNIGFLKTLNRRCVAQSRARLAMVFVGNADCIYASRSGTVWRPLIDDMRMQNCLGPVISLRCPKHSKTIVLASNTDEVPLQSPFCEQICAETMPCGVHKCLKPCQPKHENEHLKCKETVTFKYPECCHEGKRFCHQSIADSKCPELVPYTFPDCGHSIEKECSKPVSFYKCYVPCETPLPCGHGTCPLKCHEACSLFTCTKTVSLTFPCGHTINTKCNEDRNAMTCKEMCTRFLPCGHPRTGECSSNCWLKQCKALVAYTYPDCGHKVRHPCCEIKGADGQPLSISPCKSSCQRKLPACGHSCTATCDVDCSTVECFVKVKFKVKHCGHEMERECHQLEETVQCTHPCEKQLEGCGHICQRLCWEPCSPEKCEVCNLVKEEKEKSEKLKTLELIREAARSELQNLDSQNIRTVTRTPLDPTADASEFFDVLDRVMKFVQVEHGWRAKVTRIEKVSNLFLLKSHLQFQLEAVDPSRVEQKFHGTTVNALESIINDGFRLPQKPGMYGAGIYFATDSSKSSQKIYTRGSNMLLLCSVIIGKSKTVIEATYEYTSHHQLKLEGFDSLFAPRGSKARKGVMFDEYVVFDVRQALPKYIVHYDDLNTLPRIEHAQLLANSGVVKISPSRYKRDSPESIQLAVVQAEYNRVDGNIQRFGKITEVWVNRNPSLEEKFEAKQNEFVSKYGDNESSRYVFAFHGTSRENAEAIFRENFRREKCVRKAFGPGIYFSEFTEESQKYGNALLLCKLLLGKEVDHDKRSSSGSYDTIRVKQSASALQDEQHCQMLIISNPDQIMPLYRIFTDKNFIK